MVCYAGHAKQLSARLAIRYAAARLVQDQERAPPECAWCTCCAEWLVMQYERPLGGSGSGLGFIARSAEGRSGSGLVDRMGGLEPLTDRCPVLRYQDFMVNEVDTQGHVVRLTSLQSLTPPEEKPAAAAPAAANGKRAVAVNGADADETTRNGGCCCPCRRSIFAVRLGASPPPKVKTSAWRDDASLLPVSQELTPGQPTFTRSMQSILRKALTQLSTTSPSLLGRRMRSCSLRSSPRRCAGSASTRNSTAAELRLTAMRRPPIGPQPMATYPAAIHQALRSWPLFRQQGHVSQPMHRQTPH